MGSVPGGHRDGATQQREALEQAGATLALVLAPRGNAERLAEVLLVAPVHAAVDRLAVVALHQQELAAGSATRLRMHDLHAEAPADRQARRLVDDGVLQPRDQRLEDVRRGRAALGQPHATVLAE